MRIEQLSLPEAEPLLLEEVKHHLRVSHSDDDTLLSSVIAAARSHIEAYLDLKLISRPMQIHLDNWRELADPAVNRVQAYDADFIVPSRAHKGGLFLPLRPVTAVSAIHTIDEANAETEWPASNYRLLPGVAPRLVLTGAAAWPVPDRNYESIRISLMAGYGASWNDVPADLHQPLLKLVAYMAYSKGDKEMSQASLVSASGIKGLLAPYMQRRF